MATNRGKDFEKVIKEAFLKIPDVSVDRLHDQTTGFAGSTNICDFIVYNYPHQYYIECKSVHGNTLPFANISKNQWQGLLEKSNIFGVQAGIICWWIDRDVTLFIPIQHLQSIKTFLPQSKSVRYDMERGHGVIEIPGKKKRVFFDYDMEQFFKEPIWKEKVWQ